LWHNFERDKEMDWKAEKGKEGVKNWGMYKRRGKQERLRKGQSPKNASPYHEEQGRKKEKGRLRRLQKCPKDSESKISAGQEQLEVRKKSVSWRK